MTNLIKSFFGSPLFTWWNSATIGTRFFTMMKGIKVGSDDQGNLYYQEKKGDRRWVIYKNGMVEASLIPAEWHGWLHHTFDTLPSQSAQTVKAWEKDHQPNLTGTLDAITPSKATGDRPAEYEAWRP